MAGDEEEGDATGAVRGKQLSCATEYIIIFLIIYTQLQLRGVAGEGGGEGEGEVQLVMEEAAETEDGRSEI